MATEIEHKFLVVNDEWRAVAAPGSRYRQGYLANSESASVRVRVADDKGYLNIKSMTLGIRRHEFEYAIPVEEAEEMLAQLCVGALIEKVRYRVKHGRHVWEVDVFEGDNEGLVVAEIELDREGEAFDIPAWAGQEVSHDARYYNVCLARHPYREWRDES